MFEPRLKKQLLLGAAMLFCIVSNAAQAVLEDPTRPPSAKASSSYVASTKSNRPRWVLTSTLVSAERRTAVINDKVVAPGDRVNGATVVSIQPSAVQLRANGQQVTLMMLKKNIKSLSQVVSSGQGKK